MMKLKGKIKTSKAEKSIKQNSKKQGIKSFLAEHEGFKQFLVKSIFLVLFFISLQFLTMPFIQNIKIPIALDIVQYTLLGAILMFGYIIFILLIKDKLDKFKNYKSDLMSLLLFGILGLLFNFLFFYYKYWISNNADFSLANLFLVLSIRYILLISSLFFFILAFFGIRTIKDIVKNFQKQLMITLLAVISFIIFGLIMQNMWKLFSFIITKIVSFFLTLTFDSVKVINNETLGVGSFVVNIGKVCSGIESILMFTALYLLILFLDWKVINKKKMAAIFLPGLIGVFLVNSIRIYLIMLIGVLYSPKLAVGIFHTNAGWVFFIAYFFIFWYLAYPWVKKN